MDDLIARIDDAIYDLDYRLESHQDIQDTLLACKAALQQQWVSVEDKLPVDGQSDKCLNN